MKHIERLTRKMVARELRRTWNATVQTIDADLGVRWYRKRGHPRSKGASDTGYQTRAARLLNHWADGIESGRIG